MRRKEKEISDLSHIVKIIQKSLVCRLALSCNDKPYIVPVSFGFDGKCIYFHTAISGKKIDYISQNKSVCFEFEQNVELVSHDDKACNWSFKYESVIGFGWVTELLSMKDKAIGLNEIMKQYSGKEWDFTEKSIHSTRVWRIDIETITGKRSV